MRSKKCPRARFTVAGAKNDLEHIQQRGMSEERREKKDERRDKREEGTEGMGPSHDRAGKKPKEGTAKCDERSEKRGAAIKEGREQT